MDDLTDDDLTPEQAAYIQGYSEALGRAALAGAAEAEDRYGKGHQDGFWLGFVEGLDVKAPWQHRRPGRGLRRARACRSLTRPPARMAVAR